MRLEVDLCWDNVERYAELSNIHLKNAAEYHRVSLCGNLRFALRPYESQVAVFIVKRSDLSNRNLYC